MGILSSPDSTEYSICSMFPFPWICSDSIIKDFVASSSAILRARVASVGSLPAGE